MRKLPNFSPKRPKLIAGSIITVTVALLSVAALLTVNSGVLATMASYLSGGNTDTDIEFSDVPDVSEGVSEIPVDSEPVEEIPVDQDIVFARPNQMKGVWLKAGTDYYLKETDTGETVKAQIDAAFAKISEWNFNTVIIPVSSNGKILFSAGFGDEIAILNSDGTRFDPLEYILTNARGRGQEPYADSGGTE